jgi:hypothetical protein
MQYISMKQKIIDENETGGSLTLRESLWLKAQMLLIVLLVSAGIARGYIIHIEGTLQTMRDTVQAMETEHASCVATHLIEDQSKVCGPIADKAELATRELDQYAEAPPRSHLLAAFGSSFP